MAGARPSSPSLPLPEAVVASTSSTSTAASQLKLEDVSLDGDTDELESFLGSDRSLEVAVAKENTNTDTIQRSHHSSEEDLDCDSNQEVVKEDL